jgi:crotonobetainyl-CoA:carnitine CoA-transferase CaiB-like acyl-CoA transferase
VAIACTDDAAWDALAKLIGGVSAGDERFATLEGRLACADDLDAVVSRWTIGQDPYDVMTRLQAAGVAAGVCQTAADRCERDPQLAHLRWLTEVTGTKIGTWPVAEVPFTLSETPPYAGGPIDRGAPCYGEDNEWVLGELLGMSSREMAELADDGVI